MIDYIFHWQIINLIELHRTSLFEKSKMKEVAGKKQNKRIKDFDLLRLKKADY